MCLSLSCNHAVHNPIACIVPPYMLRVLAMRGDPATARMARSLLDHDRELRDLRAAQSSPPLPHDGILPIADPDLCCPDRRIHDGEFRATLPGKLVRAEGDDPAGLTDADFAYDAAGQVFSLFAEEYGRNSLDGQGMPLVATVRHRRDYNNAFWNGEQMAYGTGDGKIFQTFLELSVVAHEMTHGVIQHSGGLIYENQSGALNESVADVFGALALQRARRQMPHEADWLIGRGILGPNIAGAALRSMKAPGTAYSDDLLGQDPQPWHMDGFISTTDDNGGVHVNSGIPNHAFYLFASYLGGPAWELPGRIWYHALQNLNNPMASFSQWAERTLRSADELTGSGSYQGQMLRRAWKLVGVAV
ncbi:M4 family metallopeptidase [Paracoccus sp. 1_MG-2023]|uniref:M4 family metallopeptidase n=1 Tax=unclassified Paracoccus (in: a-proteobacteria) TaxID=2688777 RepID=UPI001C0A3D3D|nr:MULTISPECIES: M4 family metallopeptidase [unclassified Paracoccus (in: a-proteobacteria)]MBU2958141.1 peptidase M4 family protein [Paracoccus sp. C2R09]MDO6669273.1 M4 family metallopeptidase [Paracoccus sp. 1_MG-2023]